VSGFRSVLRRDLRLAFRHGADSLLVVGFFALAVVLFPFGVGPEPNVLARIAPGIVWVAALLASLISLERLFAPDYEDGSLDLLVLAPMPLAGVVIAKVLAHWIATGLMVIVAAPVLGLLLRLEAGAIALLAAALALATPVLSLIGAVGAALVLGSRRGSVLLAILLLPLYIPVLIFGSAAVDAAVLGFSAEGPLLMLAALFLAALALSPWAAAVALRQAIE
jgi:heme exporter protein B